MKALHTIAKHKILNIAGVLSCLVIVFLLSVSVVQASNHDPVLQFSNPDPIPVSGAVDPMDPSSPLATPDPIPVSGAVDPMDPSSPLATPDPIPVSGAVDPMDPSSPLATPDSGGITTGSGDPFAAPGPEAAAGGGATSNTNNNEKIPETIIGSGFLNGLYGFVLIFFGKILVWMVGIFNFGIMNFTIGFGDLYLNWGVGFAVEEAWGTVRDILNLTFIFGLIYIGFRMILFADDAQAKRTLGTLIGAALLINFSLFITKFIIDIANSLTAVIFNSGFDKIQDNIGNAMLNLIGLSSVFNIDGKGIIDITSAGTGAGLALIFGTMFFLITAAFVFAAGGILLIIRAIALVFFMIFSPLMFLGWVFPGLASYSKKYWTSFLGNVFMAPAYIFCIYISFRILDGFKRPIDPQSNIAAALIKQDSSIVIPAVVFFTLAIVLLIASIKVAKSMSVFGSGATLAFGGKLTGYATSYVGRNTVGRVANVAGKANDRLEGSRGGRSFKRAISLGTLGVLDERTRRNVAKAGKESKFGGSYSQADDEKFEKERSATQTAQAAKIKTEGIIKKGQDAAKNSPEHRAMVAAVTQMSDSEYANLSKSDRAALAPYLTNSQTDSLLKSDKLDDAEKAKIKDVRQDSIRKVLESSGQSYAENIANLSKEQIETLGDEFVRENNTLFTDTQMDDIKKSSKFTESQKGEYIATRKDTLKKLGQGGDDAAGKRKAGIKAVMHKRKPKDVAELPKELLLNGLAIPYLNEDVLKELAGKLNAEEKSKLQRKIETISSTTGDGEMQRNIKSAKGYFGTPHAQRNWLNNQTT